MSDNIDKIKELVKQFYQENKKEIPFNKAPVSGKVFNEQELINLTDAALDCWWTEGKYSKKFENKLKDFLGMSFCSLCNSGSSANLLALKALTSIKLKERRIKKGDEIITTPVSFPTTINPIILAGCVPVFVDVDIPTYNVKVEDVKKAITDKTKAVFLAHTLGNPFQVEEIKQLCKEHNLWLIEDDCDSLGSKYNGKYTGTFGDLSCLSFYPAHHITTAEGGAVLTNNPELYKIVESIRDWGRDCWCGTGCDDTCKRRFKWQLGNLPYGYDHKYIYSEIGYNLKITDLQSAIGLAQMDKLPDFIEKRKQNFNYLYEKLKDLDNYFILPKAQNKSEPSWFGFPITIKNPNINRTELMQYLNDKGIATRLLFAGNITKQPYFVDYKIEYRQIGKLENADIIMNNTFWVGVYPGLNEEHLNHIEEQLRKYANSISN